MVLQRVANPFLVFSRHRFESYTLRHDAVYSKFFWVRDIHQPAKDVCRKRMCGSGDLKPAPMVDVAQQVEQGK